MRRIYKIIINCLTTEYTHEGGVKINLITTEHTYITDEYAI